ncbi:PREDICTED: anaphase-promoting complex subunit 2 [Ceratosolen solmsi marchali]|uniref:Anaphase-promoting complex subunit 2 n=1 Tax=Ceratosolen solmsi marchali TaxID=326594 RepID=A0AAJ6YW60_9HYME|nr:PREDICTED: anaphase-promoting complex subunit 2 [Ceratosolen solmsi marchali]
MDNLSNSSTNSSTLEKWLEYNFPILINKIKPDVQNDDMEATEENFKMLSLSFCLQSLVIPKIEKYMRIIIAPKFWSKFVNVSEIDEKQGFQNFTTSVNELYTDSSKLLPMLKKLELAGSCKDEYCMYSQVNILDYFKLIIRGTLLSQIPLYHTTIIEHFYKTAFNVFCNIEASSTTEDLHNNSTILCEGCKQEQSNCQCQIIVDVFHETNKKLIQLGLLERLVGSILTSLIHIRIESHVHRVCNRTFDSSQLEPLECWLETVVMNWLIRIYSGGSSRSMSLDYKVRNAINTFKQKLSYFLYETYTRERIDQLFNIVIEYPDSRAAVDDLRICLERTDLRKYLIRTLQEALKTRLLHPGVSTPDILTAYIAAIKALRQLDPTGMLLETITEPIKVYLRRREDTVRCVVSGLLDESSTSDLADELARGGESIQLDVDGGASPQEDKEDWENWQPDPVDADPTEFMSTTRGRRRVSDIISMLVNVYGSQDLFVNEYRTLLADRLLSQLNYQTDREIRHLELLKRRFGEHQLHHCEVMIKDIYDSKRIDGNVQLDKKYNSEKANFSTSALILSAQFWPPFKEEWKLELPVYVQEQLDKYVKAFEALKGNRTLCWKPHLGNVNLDIETRDRKLNLNISPIHATLILHFQDKNEWNLDELSELMHVPTTVLRRKIGYWVSQALLVETSRDTFSLQEEIATNNSRNIQTTIVTDMIDDEEVESAMASASDQREEELQVFWSYIVGMLTNLDSMPLDRIHQMLKMFASQGSGAVECGLPELRLFLDNKVRQHQLLFSSGLYKLPKP